LKTLAKLGNNKNFTENIDKNIKLPENIKELEDDLERRKNVVSNQYEALERLENERELV